MGGSSSSSGGGGGSSRSLPPPSVRARSSYVTTPSGRPIFTSRGNYVRIDRSNSNMNRGGGGGGNDNNPIRKPTINPNPPPAPTPTPTPIVEDGTGAGKILNPTVLLLQREQRNRRLGRNYFSLLGVSEQFTGARRNSLF